MSDTTYEANTHGITEVLKQATDAMENPINVRAVVNDILPTEKPHRRADLKEVLPSNFWDQVRAHKEPDLNGDPHEQLASAMHVKIICRINRELLNNSDPRLLEIEYGEQSWIDAFTQQIERLIQ